MSDTNEPNNNDHQEESDGGNPFVPNPPDSQADPQGQWANPNSENPEPRSAQRRKTASGLQLGPMTLADMLDGSIKLIRANWKEIGIAVLAYSVPLSILTILVIIVTGDSNNDVQSLGDAVGGFTLVLLQLVYMALLYPLLQATVLRIASASYLGRQMTAKEAFDGVSKKWGTLVGAGVLLGVAFFVLVLPCGLPLVFVGPILSLTVAVIAVEEKDAISSITRSWKLFTTRYWPYLGTVILVVVIAIFLGIIVQSPLTLISDSFYDIGLDPIAWLFDAISSIIVELIVLPFIAITTLLIYFDARIRNEGFDLQVMSNGQDPQEPGGITS